MRKSLLLGLLIIVLTGCAGLQTPQQAMEDTPTPTSVPPTATPTSTMTPTPTAIPPTDTPTNTPVPPTKTPTPTATPRPLPPTPTPTPTMQGRFVFQVATGGPIYTVNADGSSLTLLTTGMDPSWSPDGTQITFSRWTSPWGIYIANADGSNERLVFSSNVARTPVWSPDGTQIAFYFETEGWTAPWIECIDPYGCITIIPPHLQTEWHLGVVDIADGYLHQLYNERFCFAPTWSADGQWLVYDGDHGLSMTTVEGPNNQSLTDSAQDSFPVWSPDGARIAFMHWQHDHWEIYIMNADGGGRRPLTSSSALLETRPNNVSPAWSPDGKHIAFLSDRGGRWQFYVMNADGSNQRKILESATEALNIQYNSMYERVIAWTR